MLTTNNFRFIILHTLNLVRTGFCNREGGMHSSKFLHTQVIKNYRERRLHRMSEPRTYPVTYVTYPKGKPCILIAVILTSTRNNKTEG